MRQGAGARAATLAGLLAIAGLLLWPPWNAWAAAASLPILLLAALGIKPASRWGGWCAILMVPYLPVAAMNILVGPMMRAPAVAFGVATVVVFCGGLAWTRRTGASLRR